MVSTPLLSKILQQQTSLTFSSVPDGCEPYAMAQLLQNSKGDVLYIARDDARMMYLADAISFFAPDVSVLTFPAWDCVPYDRVSPHQQNVSARIETLAELAQSSAPGSRLIITTVNSVLQRVLPREVIEASSLFLSVGQEISPEECIDFLVHNGYRRSATANEAGEFAVRGSILDIVTGNTTTGLRLDWFGNQIETLRLFDPLTQITHEKVQGFTLLPANEVILNEETITQFRQQYRQHAVLSANQDDPLYDAISQGRCYAGMEHWLPFFYPTLSTLWDYLSLDCLIVQDHLSHEAQAERIKLIDDHYDARCEQKKLATADQVIYHPVPVESLYLSEEEIEQHIAAHTHAQLYPYHLPEQSEDSATYVHDVDVHHLPPFVSQGAKENRSAFQALSDYIHEKKQEKRPPKSPAPKYVVSCHTQGSLERLTSLLHEYDFHTVRLNTWADSKKLSASVIGLVITPIERGFTAGAMTLFTEQDILGEWMSRSRSRSKKQADNFLNEASNLMEGEIVVHKEHGIGRFDGLETLTVENIPHDCVRLIYDGEDKLYIPVENIDVLSRYGSSEAVKLDKLGGASWQSRKAKLKERITIAASELLRTAAERVLHKAPILSPMKGLYEEFCARFPYAETEDQLSSLEDITQDFTSGAPSERLICGDVGFGKTEIALRAAAMAVLADKAGELESDAGYQVALIAPTTLLSRQHYQTFKKRFEGFPVEIRQLSRMVSNAEAKETRELLKQGKVDILIGTHAALSKHVSFHQLALLIIDEEQHFGVAQKERLKSLRSNIHVLTLSATPIPRTLQMSLTGIKELSLITTPPVDRLAVRTFVMPFDPVIIREAILREHYRGGRSFYVCPRIKDLDDVEKTLKELVPEVKIVKAHGQMPSQDLDEIMNAFFDGSYDVLLSTTIVESGLDIPSANTMIIHRADSLGLAQLYQLRGRVGRGKIRAYAYLTTPPKKLPSELAKKRLSVMQTLDSLGAGFSLASHDMDIRGFGNLVGEKQSGQVKEVGIELYQQMLKDTIEELKAAKGEDVESFTSQESWSPHIAIGLPVLIPEAYIADLSLRMGLYRRIASLDNEKEIDSLAAEMIDRFGSLPIEVENLFAVVRLKQLCRQANIEKIDTGAKGAIVTFRHNQVANPEALLSYITQNPKEAKLRGDQKLVLLEEWKQEKILSSLHARIQSLCTLMAA